MKRWLTMLLVAAVCMAAWGCRSMGGTDGLRETEPIGVVIKSTILDKNPCYTAGRTIDVKGLMLHSVGGPQPSADVWVRLWNREDYGRACVHAFIDAHTGVVNQTLPWNHRGWHCASGPNGSGNNTHIGVEMCEPECLKYVGGAAFECTDQEKAREMARRTYESAVNLFAYLCHEFHLDPMERGVVISHAEGHAMGIASGHADPEHLWRQLGMELSMDSFRRDVRKQLANY